MPRLKMPSNGLLFANRFSRRARETIYFEFLFLLFSLLSFPVTRPQDLKRTSRANCGYDIIQKGERIINSLNIKVINSLNKAGKLFYFKYAYFVVAAE